MAAWTRFGGRVQPFHKEFPKEAKDDFEARNKTHAKIEPDKIETSFEITLIALDKATGGVTFVPALIQIARTPFCTLELRAAPPAVLVI